MIWWFLGVLGLSLVVAFIGSRLKPKTKPLCEDAYYEQVRKDCVAYAEKLYCRK